MLDLRRWFFLGKKLAWLWKSFKLLDSTFWNIWSILSYCLNNAAWLVFHDYDQTTQRQLRTKVPPTTYKALQRSFPRKMLHHFEQDFSHSQHHPERSYSQRDIFRNVFFYLHCRMAVLFNGFDTLGTSKRQVFCSLSFILSIKMRLFSKFFLLRK